MPSTTVLRGLTQGTVGGDTGAWGGELNNTIGFLDTILGQTTIFQSSTYGTAATVTSSQAQSARLVINNTSSQAFQLNLPASNFAYGNFDITNNSSQSQGLTVTAGSSGTGGTSVTIQPSLSRIVFSDGVNISFADSQFIQTGIEFGIDGGGAVPLTGVKPGISMPFTFTAQGWRIDCADSSAANISVNFFSNYALISGASSLGFTSALNGSGTSSGWGTTIFSSGTFMTVVINSVSVGTKYTASILGFRTT